MTIPRYQDANLHVENKWLRARLEEERQRNKELYGRIETLTRIADAATELIAAVKELEASA